jgi:hypothetical protein
MARQSHNPIIDSDADIGYIDAGLEFQLVKDVLA